MTRADNKTTRRTLEILETFQQHKKPLSLTELARLLRMPISSCHAIVRTLAGRGYLYGLETDRTLYPTKRLLRLAETLHANDPVLRRLGKALVDLRDFSGETVLFGKQRGDIAIYLDVVESQHEIRYSAQPGDTKPLHASSIGKALMAMMGDDVLDAWLSKHPLPRWSRTTITDPRCLRADLVKARTLGYHVSDGEKTDDVMAVAVGLMLGDDPVAVAIAGPKSRMPPMIEKHAALLIDWKRRFSRA